MPTGYTAKLMEKGQTFQEYVLTCARAFGALIMMRDAPNDASIPDEFRPSNRHVEELEKEENKYIHLKSMTDDERIEFGQKAKRDEIKRNQEWLEKDQMENKRLNEMESQVLAWKPPTKDHEGLKDFMLQQINISKNNENYILEAIEKATKKSPSDYYIEAVSKAQWNINYHTEEGKKEIERTNGRNEWIKQLRASI